ncbi:flippase [Halopseudomonas sabulinigri]|uniref:Flippase n=1 Tax=Halopseudomonas sabulinigri TaxID=472181 RepID=A0ABP9ZQ14_9GAMM
MNSNTKFVAAKKYILNILWIFVDKGASLLITFLTTVVVARYLGPSDYGILAYAISLGTLFAVAGHMGLSGLVVRELVKHPERADETLGTCLGLKFIGMLSGFCLLLIYAVITEWQNTIKFSMILIIGSAMLFNCFDVVDYWFQSKIKARYITISRVAGIASASLFKISLCFTGLSLLYFSLGNLIQSIVIAGLFIAIYKLTTGHSVTTWKFNKERARKLFSEGWLIYAGSVFAIVNLKADQIMLEKMSGSSEVGIYAVAAQLSEAIYFIPIAIVATLFPKLISIHQNKQEFTLNLQRLFDLLFALAITIAIAFTFAAPFIISFFFGAAYSESSDILQIHIWACIFIFLRAAFSKWIIIEGALIFSLITQGLGAFANIAANLYLIPKFGGEGAAYATLLSYAASSYISLAIYEKTRPVFFMMTKAYLSPFRYLMLIASGKMNK